ncbi:MAG: AAA family ATPase [Desulfurococcales archaeon]|nr:AAA family ATPase [Desulfurococcales archaeon]
MIDVESSVYITLVVGTPGTGKTLIGAMLSEELQCRFMDSSTLFIKEQIVKPDHTGRYTYIVDYDKALKVIVNLLRNAACYVVETHYPSLWIEAVESYIPFIILLRTHPLLLYDRLRMKGWPEPKIVENAVAEATNVIAEELYEWRHMVLEVDTTNRDPIGVMDDLFNSLYEWRTGIRIDWLSRDESLTSIVSKWLIDLDRYKYGFRE